jgi:hypothetical protein
LHFKAGRFKRIQRFLFYFLRGNYIIDYQTAISLLVTANNASSQAVGFFFFPAVSAVSPTVGLLLQHRGELCRESRNHIKLHLPDLIYKHIHHSLKNIRFRNNIPQINVKRGYLSAFQDKVTKFYRSGTFQVQDKTLMVHRDLSFLRVKLRFKEARSDRS